jgi:hypothetical protein
LSACNWRSRNAYAAYIDTGEEQVLSVSPELFFDWDGQHMSDTPHERYGSAWPQPGARRSAGPLGLTESAQGALPKT